METMKKSDKIPVSIQTILEPVQIVAEIWQQNSIGQVGEQSFGSSNLRSISMYSNE